MTPEQRIQQLEKQVKELLDWKKARIAQQIVFPLDTNSFQVLNKYFLSKVGNIWYTNSSGGLFKDILVKQNGYTDSLAARSSLTTYSVNVSTNVFNIGQDVVNLRQGAFFDDEQVQVIAGGDVAPGGDVPIPLSTALVYWVVNANADGTKIQLSATMGGAAINITDNGTGQQYIFPF